MKHNKQKRSAPSQRLKMHILGSAGDVSGSLFFFEYTDASKKITRFLLECGLHQEHESINHEKRLPKGVAASDINFVIISHAHIDHSGWLPALVKDGFAGAVYTHPATKDLLQFLLADSGRLQEMAAARSNKRILSQQQQQQTLALAPKAGTKSGAKGTVKNTKVLPLVEPLYRAEDAAKCFPLIKSVNYNQLYTIADGVAMRFTEASHILGAAVVTLTIGKGEEARTVCFTGNVGRPNTPLLNELAPVKFADYVISESTYGNKLHQKRDRLAVLADIVNKAYARAKVKERDSGSGVILIPAFAVGRVQAVLFDLRTLMLAKRIPDIAVFLDSKMAIEATKVHRKWASLYNDETRKIFARGEDPFSPPRYLECSKPEMSNRLYEKASEPIIVVGSSGMAAGGKILTHMEKRLPQKNSTVLFVGYQGSGALGFDLVNNKPSQVRVHGKTLPVRATIEYMSDYSGHADYEEIIAWMKLFENKPKQTFLVHGDGGSLEKFQQHIEAALGWSVVVPSRGQTFDLI
jgi:metallo-beta-lactamase family protein